MTDALFLIPEYSGGAWEALPHLKAGADELAALLVAKGLDVHVAEIDTAADLGQALDAAAADGTEPLFVYVGGHGIVNRRSHYTAVDTTPADAPNAINALWSALIGDLLASRGRDVVVILDSCYSGEAAARVVVEAMTASLDDEEQQAFGVVASCRAFESAEDGRFVETMVELVRNGPRHDINAWGPGDRHIRTGALLMELRHLGFDVYGDLFAGELRFLPNPLWEPEEPEGRVDAKAKLRRLTRGAEKHFEDKSTGFLGRVKVRQGVVDWLSAGAEGTYVITGGPGTGKSALMGLIARQTAGEPGAILDDGVQVPEGSFDAVVHARQKTLDAVRAELADALTAEGRAVILVDALDEAVAGEAPGIAAYLASLARRNEAAILIGTRPDPALGRGDDAEDSLLRELRAELVNRLEDDETAQADIAALVRRDLSNAPQYADAPVAEIADLTASFAKHSFLFAQATARWLASFETPLSDDPAWRDRLIESAGDLGKLVEDDLASRYPNDLDRVRDLMRAVAWAEGLGLPRYGIWRAFAQELSGNDYSDDDVTWLLNEAGWYLTEASEDGQTVYRPFHQALVDHFRAETGLPAEEVQRRITARLLGAVDKLGSWARADRYTLHYLVAHAEQAGTEQVVALLNDHVFAAYADADRLSRAARRHRGETDALLEQCAYLFAELTSSERFALMALTRLQEDGDEAATLPVLGASWWPLWSRWRRSTPHTVLVGHELAITDLAYSSTGLLASVSIDGTVRVWDGETGDYLRTLRHDGGGLDSVAWSPDSRTVAAGTSDGAIVLWSAHDGRLLRTIDAHEREATVYVAYRSEQQIVSAATDGTFRCWEVATGQRVGETVDVEDEIISVAASPDGNTAAFATRTAVFTYVLDAEELRTFPGVSRIHCVRWSPDGTVVATGENDAVRVWDVHSGLVLRTLTGHTDWIRHLAFRPGDDELATVSDDQTVRLWTVARDQAESILVGHTGWIRSVDFAPTGRSLASGGDDSTVRLWDEREARKAIDPHDLSEPWNAVAVSPDGTTIGAANNDGTVHLLDSATGKLKVKLTGHWTYVSSVAISGDAQWIASGSYDRVVRLWDMESGECRYELKDHSAIVNSIAFSRDSTMLASGGHDLAVRLWDVTSGTQLSEGRGHAHRVTSVAFGVGSDVYSADRSGVVMKWESAKETQPADLAEDAFGITTLSVSPDGSVLASAGITGSLGLRSTRTGEDLMRFDAHRDTINSVAFSPEGERLASAGADGMVRVWDVASGDLIMDVPTRSINTGVAWSVNDRLVIASNVGLTVIEVL